MELQSEDRHQQPDLEIENIKNRVSNLFKKIKPLSESDE